MADLIFKAINKNQILTIIKTINVINKPPTKPFTDGKPIAPLKPEIRANKPLNVSVITLLIP